jgi:REP element-mobilizing transposase RayT
MPSDWVPEAPMEAGRMPFLDARLPAEAAPTVPAPARLPLFTLLVPRLPEHLLTGELAERLQAWTARLCLAWDWTVERIDVRPDRFEVTLILPPDEAPAHALQELRDGLSERVFRSFPELALDLPSRRFWASSSLLRAGGPPPEAEIDAFLRGTRLAQSRSTAG